MERKKYPIRAEDYTLFETIGQGVSATVHRALCIPFDEIVAIKILDFERHNSDLNNICREAQTLILIDHPNVLNAHCSFVYEHNLWVVIPYMAGGSCLHIMKSSNSNGFEEAAIATILREVLKGLEYLHHHGHIHRDVKAGNILVDSKGAIKLGDFGVSACLFDSGDRQRSRNTFVGTPCWMAPEVMEQLHGYDFKADIWSFGITALELAHGHAPFSKYPPMKVLLMTLQNAPPGLDYERDKKFSRSFKQMIAMCLVKDPSRRPSAQKLLKQPFFKQARSQNYICRTILEGLPSLGDRHRTLKEKEEDMLAQKKIPDGKKEEMSQNEYNRGISSWNFDMEDLKSQASLIPSNEENPSQDSGGCSNSLFGFTTSQGKTPGGMCYSASCSSKDDDDDDDGDDDDDDDGGRDGGGDDDMESDAIKNKSPPPLSPDQLRCVHESKAAEQNHHNNLQNEMIFDGKDRENCSIGSCESEIDEKNMDRMLVQPSHQKKLSGSCSASELTQPSYERTLSISSLSHERRFSMSFSADNLPSSQGESLKTQNQHRNMGNCFGDVSLTVTEMPAEAMLKASKSTASSIDDLDDKSKPPVVQQKGRFKVTSEKPELDKTPLSIGLQKSHSMQVISQVASPNTPTTLSATSAVLSTASIFQQMLSILQTTMLQRDCALSVMKQLCTGEQSAHQSTDAFPISVSAIALLEASHEREKELIQEITDMQWRSICKDDEIHRLKIKIAQVTSPSPVTNSTFSLMQQL